MTPAFLLADLASELALFAAAGYLLFAIDDLLVDLIYFTRRLWRGLTVYSRYPRAFADRLPEPARPGRIAVFVPAWDESTVIADMLRTSLHRWGDADYRIFVGHYRNDPATAAALAKIDDRRIEPVLVEADGPTTGEDADHAGAMCPAEPLQSKRRATLDAAGGVSRALGLDRIGDRGAERQRAEGQRGAEDGEQQGIFGRRGARLILFQMPQTAHRAFPDLAPSGSAAAVSEVRQVSLN